MILEKIRGKTKGANGMALRGLRLFTDVTEGVRPMQGSARTQPNGEPVKGNAKGLLPFPREMTVTPSKFRATLERMVCCPVGEAEAAHLFKKWDIDGGGTLEPSEIITESILPVPYSIMKVPPPGFVPGASFVNQVWFENVAPYKRKFGLSGVR